MNGREREEGKEWVLETGEQVDEAALRPIARKFIRRFLNEGPDCVAIDPTTETAAERGKCLAKTSARRLNRLR